MQDSPMLNNHEGGNKRSLPKDVYCGYGSCRPRWARACGNMKTFTLNLSVILLFHIGFYSYFVGVMRTMEKRFALTSAQTGVLNSTNDIIQVCIVLFTGFAGQRAHKARMLSLLILLTFVGALFFTAPYFVFGPKKLSSTTATITAVNISASHNGGPSLCSVTNETESCGTEEEKLQIGKESYTAYVIVAVGCVALGFGGSSNSVLGFSYIDENSSKADSSIYVGIATSMYPWGPIVGFLLAAVCTSLPEDLIGSAISSSDPNFIGAWWLGFVIIGLVILLSAVPLFFFPKHMPAYYEDEDRANAAHKKAMIKQQQSVGGVAGREGQEEEGILSVFREFPRLFRLLLTNWPFWTHALAQVCSLYVVVGVLIQQPRFLEVHFHQTAAMAGVLAATSGAVSGVLGNMGGGIIMRKLKLQPKGMAMMAVIAGAIACVGTAIKIVMACPAVQMAGIRHPSNPGKLELTLPCNSNCSCTQSRMEPICVDGTTTYFSPCHAGCTQHFNQTFSDCACLPDSATVTPGMCETTCNMLIPYVVGYFIVTLLSLVGRVPSTILTFRLVDKQMKSFAFGFVSFLINLITFIPGPIIFGMLVDSTCLIWQDVCGKTGACLFYDIKGLRILPHGVTLCVQVAGLLLSILTWWLVKRDKRFQEPDVETYTVEEEKSLSKNNNIKNGRNGVLQHNVTSI